MAHAPTSNYATHAPNHEVAFTLNQHNRGMKVAGILYTVLATSVQNDVEPRTYLRQAVETSLRDEQAPLPHELKTA